MRSYLSLAHAEVAGLADQLLHFLEPAVGEARLDVVLGEVGIAFVVDERRTAGRADGAREDLAPVAAAAEHVGHLHAGLESCEREQFRRLVAGVALAILGAALGRGDGLGDVIRNFGGLQ